MSGNPNDLYVQPLVMDALSGDFVHPANPQKTHTLGRLMAASYARGIRHPMRGMSLFGYSGLVNAHATRVYKPSWGDGITAKTWVRERVSPAPYLDVAVGLSLHAEDNTSTLELAFTERGVIIGGFAQNGQSHTITHNISLAANLDAVRDHLAGYAQQFFVA
jgi:hypothetical protein